MNKILKIAQSSVGDKVEVTIEGYPTAYPLFDSGLSQEELQAKVDEWAAMYDEIQAINDGTASQEIIDKYSPSAEDRFDPEVAIGREAQVFPIDRIMALAPFTYTINEMLKWKNFDQLKLFLGGLVAQGLATEDDFANFAQILAEQGIDINDY